MTCLGVLGYLVGEYSSYFSFYIFFCGGGGKVIKAGSSLVNVNVEC